MKTNNDYKGNGTLIGPPGGKYYQAWAKYYLKFFQAYKQNNIEFWGLTAQNEPSDGYIFNFSFNAMGFTPETQAQFIVDNLGPTLEANGFGDLKIMILDDQRVFLPSWAERVINSRSRYFEYLFLFKCSNFRFSHFLQKHINTYLELLYTGTSIRS